jgi:carbon monoxide dehydrogenase subunit G
VIETSQSVRVAAPLELAWNYARDVDRWAQIMPGYQACEITDADNSVWTLKVGVGGLVRTVKVAVHVTRWAGPQEVDFAFRLLGDPVEGAGSYRAAADGDGTAITLAVQVRGSGPMAPMWEAMGGPVLPRFARSFAEDLKARIEAETGAAGAAPRSAGDDARASASGPSVSLIARMLAWLRRLFR